MWSKFKSIFKQGKPLSPHEYKEQVNSAVCFNHLESAWASKRREQSHFPYCPVLYCVFVRPLQRVRPKNGNLAMCWHITSAVLAYNLHQDCWVWVCRVSIQLIPRFSFSMTAVLLTGDKRSMNTNGNVREGTVDTGYQIGFEGQL